MQLSKEQVLSLAPDESSQKAGKGLAEESKWITRGVNDVAIWGECKGSGNKPYQTQIDLGNIAFKCSCPSRKFPCKHGLGLLLLYTDQPEIFKKDQIPAWVQEWISKRAGLEEKKAEKKDKPLDEAAQEKRKKDRQQKVKAGMEELLLWVKDIVRNGILTMPEKGDGFWESMARRMVDAQAPGLAGMVREISRINFFLEGWQSQFTDQLLRVYLIIQAYKNVNTFGETLQADIKAMVGFTQSQEELKQQPGVKDSWLVLGKQVHQEDQLTIERIWLYGATLQRYALILQFLVRNQVPSLTLAPGTVTIAELVFYPSAYPLRALIKEPGKTQPILQVQGFQNWMEVSQQETFYNAHNPFIPVHPFIVSNLTPLKWNEQWWLTDSSNQLMRVDENFHNIWKLLALSGGSPLTLAVIGKENSYLPLGAWHQDQYKLL